jgi:hypothetical protein
LFLLLLKIFFPLILACFVSNDRKVQHIWDACVRLSLVTASYSRPLNIKGGFCMYYKRKYNLMAPDYLQGFISFVLTVISCILQAIYSTLLYFCFCPPPQKNRRLTFYFFFTIFWVRSFFFYCENMSDLRIFSKEN